MNIILILCNNGALYKAKTQDYKGAFLDIDDAISSKPNNFSIKTTRAINIV